MSDRLERLGLLLVLVSIAGYVVNALEPTGIGIRWLFSGMFGIGVFLFLYGGDDE